jgi:apolipoprotein N-acyltransferase
MNKKDLMLPVLSGILIFLSFPQIAFSIAAFFALVPLLHVLRGKTPREGFAAGALTGLIGNIGILYWVTFVVVEYGYLPVYAGLAAMLALAAFLSLYTGLFAAGVTCFRARGLPDILTAPLLWTSIEYGRSHLLTGFPWENLGYSQYLNTYLVQIADITGTYGITFFIIFINVVIYDFLIIRNLRNKALLAEVIAGIVLVLSIAGYGYYRVGVIEKAFKNRPSKEILIVQGNIDQSIKWNPAYQRETLNIYGGLSIQGSQPKKDLIVWPETAAPFYFQDVNDLHRDVVDTAVRSGSYLLFGSPSYVPDSREEHVQNSAFIVSPAGRVEGKYDKVHLVPFGEYVPLRSVFPFMGRLAACVGDCLPGKSFTPVRMGDVKIGVLICYEGIFPEIARDYIRNGASVLVNITNDAWFGRSSAPYQHLSMVTFRSIENRIYTVRAANTGISAIIDPVGRITAKTKIFERTTLSGKVHLSDGQTFYAKHGDIFVYGCFSMLVLVALITMRRRKK